MAYSPAGGLLWADTYNSAGDGSDVATAVAVDSQTHDVFVAGYTFAPSGGIDFTTVGYDPSGNQLWFATYDGPGHGSD